MVATRALVHRSTPDAPLLALADDQVTVVLFGQWLWDNAELAAILERESQRWPTCVRVACSLPAKTVLSLECCSTETIQVEWADGALSFDPGEIFVAAGQPEDLGLVRAP